MEQKEIKELYKNLVNSFGDDDELLTFEFCSEYGCNLACSTIDMVRVAGDDIRFVYNQNENDWDSIDRFEIGDLLGFYKDLVSAIAEHYKDILI